MALPQITGEFRVVADPELKFAPSGMAIGTMRIVANSRKKEGDEWVDDKVCWLRATAFKREAENLAESYQKSDLVIITGRLQTEEWEKDGVKQQSYGILIDHIGPSTKYNPAKVERTARSSGTGGGGGQQSAPATDPWATTATEEPPF
jgi:single-strand DNA-binding protein